DAQRQLTAAPRLVTRRDEVHLLLQRPQQLLEKVAELHRLRAQPLHARLGEDRQRGDERRGGEDRRVADLPGGRAGGGAKLRLHQKTRRLLVTPPAGEPRARQAAAVVLARLRVHVTLVDEAAADGTGAAVQVLVTAPHREVRSGLVQRQGRIADGMREVEAGNAAVAVRGADDAREVERLAGAKLHSRPQHQGDLLAVLPEAGLDGLLRPGVFARARRQL